MPGRAGKTEGFAQRSPERRASDSDTLPESVSTGDSKILDVEAKLRAQVESWRKKLLDLGNRNPLINCSFNASRGVVEIVHPDCESVWKQLVTNSEAGSTTMRFPWRRDLVPPPKSNAPEALVAADTGESEKPKEWNPPLEECLSSRRLGGDDVLTSLGDKAIDRRLRRTFRRRFCFFRRWLRGGTRLMSGGLGRSLE